MTFLRWLPGYLSRLGVGRDVELIVCAILALVMLVRVVAWLIGS